MEVLSMTQSKWKRWVWLVFVSIFLLTGCCFVVPSFGNGPLPFSSWKEIDELSVPLAQGSIITADLEHFDLTITGKQTDQCTITGRLRVRAWSRGVAQSVIEELRVELVERGGMIEIVIEEPDRYFDDYRVSGALSIHLPARTGLDLSTTHGDCRVRGMGDRVKIKSTHGDLDFEKIQAAVVGITTHGDVSIRDVRSPTIEVETTHGEITLEECDSERVNLSTTHDAITLGRCIVGILEIRTTHDPIQLRDCRVREAILDTKHGAIRGDLQGIESVHAKTSHAPIDLTFNNDAHPNMVADLQTTHNNIFFTVPSDFAGTLSMSASHGKIETTHPMTIHGRLNDDHLSGAIGKGSGSITLRTTHGNIMFQ
jgi:hypothetical protein